MRLRCALILLAIMAGLAACGGPDHHSQPALSGGGGGGNTGGEQPTPMREFDFEYSGLDQTGAACTTGLRRHDTRHALCIGLQIDGEGWGCALDERLERFGRDCKDYSFYESHACRATLLDLSAEISASGLFDERHVVNSKRWCVGRTAAGPDLTGVSDHALLHEDILVAVTMTFVPRKEEERSARRSAARIVVSRTPQSGQPQLELLQPFEYHDGSKAEHGLLPGGRFKYVLSCGTVGSCDDK